MDSKEFKRRYNKAYKEQDLKALRSLYRDSKKPNLDYYLPIDEIFDSGFDKKTIEYITNGTK